MTRIMAIDQGTSSSRAMVFDLDHGTVLGSAQEEFDNAFPADGWVEQDPAVLWRTSLSAGRRALTAAGLQGGDLAAIGITNQRETTLVWDRRTGECVHPAIVWQDRRTAGRCEVMRGELAETVARQTGLVVDPYFSGTKLAWLLDEVPGVRARAERGELCFGTVDSYLIWRLTGGARHVTDATNASRTLLFDIGTQAWSQELLDYLKIPASLLPDVLDSAAEFGVADAQWFGAPVPVTGVAGDQQAALVGQACFEPGMSKSTYGTGCFAVTNCGEQQIRSSHQLLTTVAYRLGGRTTYALEGSIFSAGVAVKWLRDKLRVIDHPAETEAAARRCGGDTGGVYVVPAFTGLGAPHWNADARGTVVGLTLDSTRDQVVTATLASVAYQSQELLAAMRADGAALEQLRVDGGMVVNDWLCQFLADVLDCPVQRPSVTETTALGAALLAALGVGATSNLQEAGGQWRLDREFLPAMAAAERQRLLDGWQRAVARAL